MDHPRSRGGIAGSTKVLERRLLLARSFSVPDIRRRRNQIEPFQIEGFEHPAARRSLNNQNIINKRQKVAAAAPPFAKIMRLLGERRFKQLNRFIPMTHQLGDGFRGLYG